MKDNYIVIQGWMVTELKLSGNNLLAYALIYGFSQDGNSEFTGSINYVCNWLNCSRPTAIKALKELCELKLISKSENNINGVVFNRYKISLEGVKNLNGGSKESLHRGSKETLPNNTIINNTNNNIEERKLKFASTLEPFLQTYGRDLLKDFYKYWTEPNKSVTKLRFESEKFWDLNRRLVTWKGKEKTFAPKKEKPTMRSTNEAFDEAKQFILNGGVINQ